MKPCLFILTCLFALVFLPRGSGLAQEANPNPPANLNPPAGGEISLQTFYDELSSFGTWIQTDAFGYVFQPGITDPNWRPYTVGYWVFSDYGWLWVSDEPFGWATYHYGRWANLDGIGWVWVPGTVWAPAWVSWRYGDGYCGWAPLPPDSLADIDYDVPDEDYSPGFHIGDDADIVFGIGAGCYSFCPEGRLGDRHLRGFIYPYERNYIFINQTANVTDLNVEHADHPGSLRVHAGGPSFDAINRLSNSVSRVSLVTAGQLADAGPRGTQFSIYAPSVAGRGAGSSPAGFRPAQVSSTVNALLNRGQDISRPLRATQSSPPVASPSAEEVYEARLASQYAPTSARRPAGVLNSSPSFRVPQAAPPESSSSAQEKSAPPFHESTPAETAQAVPPQEPGPGPLAPDKQQQQQSQQTFPGSQDQQPRSFPESSGRPPASSPQPQSRYQPSRSPQGPASAPAERGFQQGPGINPSAQRGPGLNR